MFLSILGSCNIDVAEKGLCNVVAIRGSLSMTKKLNSWSIVINRVRRFQEGLELELVLGRLCSIGDMTCDSNKIIYFYVSLFRFLVYCCWASHRRSSVHARVSTPTPKVRNKICRNSPVVNIRRSPRLKLKVSGYIA